MVRQLMWATRNAIRDSVLGPWRWKWGYDHGFQLLVLLIMFSHGVQGFETCLVDV